MAACRSPLTKRLEAGQLVRVGAEQALEPFSPPARSRGGEPEPLLVPDLPERGDATVAPPPPPEQGDAEMAPAPTPHS